VTKKLIRTLLYTALIFQIISILIPYKIVDPGLVKYDQEFHSYLNEHCPSKKYLNPIQKSIYFSDLAPGVMGVCQTNGLTKFTIVYDVNVWYNITEDQRFSTSMHESVHCYFNRGHSEDPGHFMYKEENHLPKDIVINQLVELIKEQCK
jgi:hypothetical protein